MSRLEFIASLRIAGSALLLLLLVPFLQIVPISLDGLELGKRPLPETLWILAILTLFLANLFGHNLFGRERKDDAAEYVLTFPKSRWQILGAKIGPRTAILALLTSVVETIVTAGGRSIPGGAGPLALIVDPLFFPFWVVLLFLLGAGLSLFESKNLMAVLLILTPYALGLSTAALLPNLSLWLNRTSTRQLPAFALLLASFPVLILYTWAFVSAYRRWDIQTPDSQRRPFLLKTLLPLTAMSLLATGILLSRWN